MVFLILICHFGYSVVFFWIVFVFSSVIDSGSLVDPL
jgi:hypothetical protein